MTDEDRYSVILVCGGRNLQDAPWVYSALAEHIRPWDVVVTGGARGADTIAAEFARGLGCVVRTYPVTVAEWATLGAEAGPLRNQRMLDENVIDFALVFPGGRGTSDMRWRAIKAGVRVVDVELG